MFYEYPSVPHERIHGPAGYPSYGKYKPWLRDEFSFRCVYCLARETWLAGHDYFGVDHVLPKSAHPDLECEYGNLVYCCNRCNSAKRMDSVLDPCRVAFSAHVRVEDDGQVSWLTTEGQKLVQKLKLNNRAHVRFRRGLIACVRRAMEKPDGSGLRAVRDLMGYPDDLPDLSALETPNNAKPEGIANSHLERKKRGELPEAY
jgi:hypothetical protein